MPPRPPEPPSSFVPFRLPSVTILPPGSPLGPPWTTFVQFLTRPVPSSLPQGQRLPPPGAPPLAAAEPRSRPPGANLMPPGEPTEMQPFSSRDVVSSKYDYEPCDTEPPVASTTAKPRPAVRTKCTTVIGKSCYEVGEQADNEAKSGGLSSQPKGYSAIPKSFGGRANFRGRPETRGKPNKLRSTADNNYSTGSMERDLEDISTNNISVSSSNASSIRTKSFGGKSFFRGISGNKVSRNKTFESKAFFRGKTPSDVLMGSFSTRFACAVYGSTIPMLLVVVVFAFYQWKERRRKIHYRLLGSFHDTRYPEFHFDPDCDDCDYSKVRKPGEPQQV